ncbi:MAG: DUF5017 domain-containing protein [Rufibacter sp.]
MKLNYLFSLLLAGTLFSCVDEEVEMPSLNVTTDKATYAVGDSVTFKLDGNPDIITFYSGETGKEYQNRERTELSGGKLELQFESQALYGRQSNYISLLASTNFSGIYTPEEVAKATWVDISNRFTFATAAPGTIGVRTQSGKADVSDQLVSGKPVFFAFKYVGSPSPTPTQWLWRLYSFNLTNSFPNGTSAAVSNLTSTGWTSVDFTNPVSKWTYTSTLVYFHPNSTLEASEEWAISKPLNPNKVSPDRGTPIKEYSLSKPVYKYAYTKAGTYTATFVASNASIYGQETVVKEVTVTVTD